MFSIFSKSSVKAETGFEEDVLLSVYEKNFLSLPPWHVYLVYQYLHMYPKIRQCKTIFGISASSFKEIFYPTIEAMATMWCTCHVHLRGD